MSSSIPTQRQRQRHHQQQQQRQAQTMSPPSSLCSSPPSSTPSFMAEDPSLSDVSSLDGDDYAAQDDSDSDGDEHSDEFEIVSNDARYGDILIGSSVSPGSLLAGSSYSLVGQSSDDEEEHNHDDGDHTGDEDKEDDDSDGDDSQSVTQAHSHEGGHNAVKVLQAPSAEPSSAADTSALAESVSSAACAVPGKGDDVNDDIDHGDDDDATPEASRTLRTTSIEPLSLESKPCPVLEPPTQHSSWTFPDPTSPIHSIETLRQGKRIRYAGSGTVTPTRARSAHVAAQMSPNLPRSVDSPPSRLGMSTESDAEDTSEGVLPAATVATTNTAAASPTMRRRKVARTASRPRPVPGMDFEAVIFNNNDGHVATDWMAKTQEWLKQSSSSVPPSSASEKPRSLTKYEPETQHSPPNTKWYTRAGVLYVALFLIISAFVSYLSLPSAIRSLHPLRGATTPRGSAFSPARIASPSVEEASSSASTSASAAAATSPPVKASSWAWTARLGETCPTCDVVVVNTLGKSVSVYRAVEAQASAAMAASSFSPSSQEALPAEETSFSSSFWKLYNGDSQSTTVNASSDGDDWLSELLHKHLPNGLKHAKQGAVLAWDAAQHEWAYWEQQLLFLWFNHLAPVLNQIRQDVEGTWNTHYPAAAKQAKEVWSSVNDQVQAAQSYYEDNIDEHVKKAGHRLSRAHKDASTTAYRLSRKWATEGERAMRHATGSYRHSFKKASAKAKARLEHAQRNAARKAQRISREWTRHGERVVERARGGPSRRTARRQARREAMSGRKAGAKTGTAGKARNRPWKVEETGCGESASAWQRWRACEGAAEEDLRRVVAGMWPLF